MGPVSTTEGDSREHEPQQQWANHTTDVKDRSLGTHSCSSREGRATKAWGRENKVREEMTKGAAGLKAKTWTKR